MKAIFVGLGVLLLIIGFIVAFFAGGDIISNVDSSNMISRLNSYLIEVVIAIGLMVAGGILVLLGSQNKDNS